MATAFIPSSIFTASYVLTSEARSIVASTDDSKLSVSLSCSGDTFFSAVLYAYDGKVELFDPGSIIECYFQSNNLVSADVLITFGTVSKSARFLYCEYQMPRDFNPQRALLLSSPARRVHPGSKFSFAAIPVADAQMKIQFNAVGLDQNLRPVVASYTSHAINPQEASHTQVFDVDILLNNFLSDNSSMKKVLYFSAKIDSRQLMCYLSQSPAWLTFAFRNIFNVTEYIDVEGSVTEKTEISRESAFCSGDLVQYDRRTDRTYQVSTGPLHADEIESVTQLVASHSVDLILENGSYPVIIDDHSCEASSDDDSLTSIKFTWRFKGRRPVWFNSAIFGIQPTHRDIFSDEYSPEYE